VSRKCRATYALLSAAAQPLTFNVVPLASAAVDPPGIFDRKDLSLDTLKGILRNDLIIAVEKRYADFSIPCDMEVRVAIFVLPILEDHHSIAGQVVRRRDLPLRLCCDLAPRNEVQALSIDDRMQDAP
jgi:hypothetical protein